jgi:hypothetical protein
MSPGLLIATAGLRAARDAGPDDDLRPNHLALQDQPDAGPSGVWPPPEMED